MGTKSSSEESPNHLVVVGSSAGGIEALSVLVSHLDPALPAPLVIAQHLDPTRPSQLAGILERRSKLPVVVVGASTPLEAGRVYVVPSNRHVLIRDSHVELAGSPGDRPRPSIDLLLSSAAPVYGERLIAVILTGSGSDGAAGAIEVKKHGGTVIIQDPLTAAHPSMPMALPPTAVDHVADIQQMGPLIGNLARGEFLPERAAKAEDGVLEEVLSRAKRQASIDFRQYKPSTILRRIGRRMALNRIQSLEEYRDFLDSHPDEIGDLTRSLLIKVTEFFRDPEAFALLRDEILPSLIARGRERGRILRLWSAGCATGEEAYSLALLVADALGSEMPEWSVRLFATDVDQDAVAYARRGLYPVAMLRQIPPDLRSRYFEPADHGDRIHKSLRQMVIFGQQDLSRGVPFPRIDLVVCRNLLIYFQPELQQEVLDLFAYSLHQTKGFLFLGKAETARPSKATFEIVNKKWKVFRCVSGSKQATYQQPGQEKKDKGSPALSRILGSADNALELQNVRQGIDLTQARRDNLELRRDHEALLRGLPIGVAVIDRGYGIVSLNAVVRRLLEIREPGTDRDFLHTARGLPYREVRKAIDRAFQERSVVVLPEVELTPAPGESRFLMLQIVAFEGEDIAMIAVQDITELTQSRRHLEAVQVEQKQLADELGAANHRLTEMNKELQDANEELQASNEEMMLAQEELQATNEEFEATNEELQATNEELETNNEELQATNEELETTNEELQARTSELQDLTRTLSGERRRLTEMVELAPFHILVLRGPALLIESANPPSGKLFGERNIAGLPFEQVCEEAGMPKLGREVRRVFGEGKIWQSGRMRIGMKIGEEEEEEEEEEGFFVFTAVPTHDADQRTDSVVLYAEDVSARSRAEQAERLGTIRLMLEHAEQVAMAMFDARTQRIVHATREYFSILERVLGIGAEEALRRSWKDLWFGSQESAEAFLLAVSTGAPQRMPEVRVDSDAADYVWDCSVLPIRAEDPGQVRYVMLFALEITEQVQAREKLESLDRLKDEFLSLASHELRTPLAPLMNYTELLSSMIEKKERGEEWERQIRHMVDRFHRQIRHLSRLTDDLLDVARLQSGKFSLNLQRQEMERIVSEAVEEAKGIATKPPIHLEVRSKGSTVMADDIRITQVVLNLLSNAIRHAPDSERVDVTLDTVVADKGKWSRLEVQDLGPGIPPSMRDGLFQRSFHAASPGGRTSRAGLGLGLYITRAIVEQHGGRVGADFGSRGTKFWIELPLQ